MLYYSSPEYAALCRDLTEEIKDILRPYRTGLGGLRDHWSNEILTIRKALSSGARATGSNSLEWDLSGNCSNPTHRTIKAVPSSTKNGAYTIYLDILARCRSCPQCLRYRRNVWASRMSQEIRNSPRTWFATYTLSPEYQYKALCEANLVQERSALKPSEEFALRHKAIAKWFTLMFKSMRKRGLRFRYALVVEKHKSGLPHYHALLHELDIDNPVRKTDLEEAWPFGFTQFKLVEAAFAQKQAHYVSKYLGKAMEARVRASLHYGTLSVNLPHAIASKSEACPHDHPLN